MSYTVIAAAETGPVATAAASVLEALRLVHDLERGGGEVLIASDTGWILTTEELEELAKS